ncbi:MAG: sulfurtransferase complex subunit TusB [Thermoplasmata archaeon]|nr:sulfurtransferase complex subunit TusB [Thermoplasmata archaeon]
MVKTAFIVIRSPQELEFTETIRRLAQQDDASVILFEDGVYNALQKERAQQLNEVAAEVMVAVDDLEARGFSGSDLKAGKTADYDDIVEMIMERTDRTVTV